MARVLSIISAYFGLAPTFLRITVGGIMRRGRLVSDIKGKSPRAAPRFSSTGFYQSSHLADTTSQIQKN